MNSRHLAAGDPTDRPQLALDVLNEQPKIAGNPYVFPAPSGNGPFNAFSQGMDQLRALLPDDMPSFSMHDLRRAARGLMTTANVRTEIAEYALGHGMENLQGRYDDLRKYRPKIDAAFQSVADEIEKLLNPTPENNVVRLRK